MEQIFLEPTRPLSRLVVPKLVRQSPVHDWFVFPHSFAPPLVADVIRKLDIPMGATVADPFVGSGTTALAAQALGYRPLAADLMPLSCLSTRVKTASYDLVRLKQVKRGLRLNRQPQKPIDRFGTLEKAFTSAQLDELDAICAWIEGLEPSIGDFYRLALARSLEPHSKLKKAGGWLKLAEGPVENGAIKDTLLRVAGKMVIELERRGSPRYPARVDLADARALPWEESAASLAITSPPYLNKHDYTRVFCLELAIACGMTWSQIKALRHSTLRSHVEAHDPDDEVAKKVAHVERWIEEAGSELDDRLPRLVRGYFRDMADALGELARVVRPGGHVVVVVGDVRFAGRVLPVGDFLSVQASSQGWTSIGRQVARYRGNSAQQMKAHGRVGVPEWVLAWQT